MTVALLVGLIFGSLVLHELGHAGVAYLLGDTTARDRGQLTLNPIAHIDPLLTILLPAATLLISKGAFAFGGGRPVPVDRHRLRYGEVGFLLTVAAGPVVNLVLALIGWALGFALLAQINVFIALFNLIPIPPLDGWNIARTTWRLARG